MTLPCLDWVCLKGFEDELYQLIVISLITKQLIKLHKANNFMCDWAIFITHISKLAASFDELP